MSALDHHAFNGEWRTSWCAFPARGFSVIFCKYYMEI